MAFVEALVVIGGIVAFGMAFAIGANDVANGKVPVRVAVTKACVQRLEHRLDRKPFLYGMLS